MLRPVSLCRLAIACWLAGSFVAPSARAQDQAEKLAFFEKRVRPLLAQRCYACHSESAGKKKGKLALDRADALQRGGVTGPAVVAGKPDESLLIRAVRWHDKTLQMPPSGALAEREIAVLVEWVRQGAVMPVGSAGKSAGVSLADGRNHWAFQPLTSRPMPRVGGKDGSKTPIDVWVRAELDKQGLRPSAPASRRVLLRRVMFDLVGLPPTPEEMDAFEKDNAPDAYARLVDRLLASPHHGERWGRYWLDLARYCDVGEPWAENKGQAYLYRDWVVRSFHADMPYDRFVRLQLAADHQPNGDPRDLAALGFLGMSPSYWKELMLDKELIRGVVAEEWEERISTTTATFLGLTVACARCHDHKHDPITTADYYALAGVFASTRLVDRPLFAPAVAAKVTQAKAEIAGLSAQVKNLQKAKTLTPEAKSQLEALQAQIKKIQADVPEIEQPMAPAVDDAGLTVVASGVGSKLIYKPGEALNVAIQMRGDPAKEGPIVPRRFLSVLSPGEPRAFTQGSGRKELADAIVGEAAPLAARVIVNRVWKLHFGRGLVDTPSDFGFQGDRPSHPELLDDLAARFVKNGWSLRWLHREIVLSATYQQASTHDERMFKIDPDNRFLWRMSRRRLDAETWRDAMLAVTGTLDRTVGGPPQKLGDILHARRTLYSSVKRRELNDFLRLHDFPDPTTHSPNRIPTTTPLQQLFTLNSPLMQQQSKAFVQRLYKEAPDAAGRVRRAFLLAYGRPATDAQVETSLAFVGATSADASWQQFAQALLGSNEFQFVD